MKRNRFIQSLATGYAVMLGLESFAFTVNESDSHPRIPPYLKPGDIVGITSPAGFIELTDLAPAIERLKAWGYAVKIGNSIGKRDFAFGGTDEERKNDFQAMLDDSEIKCILCARGGYGSVTIIDSLDFSRFKKSPKWIVGFSDVTVFHSHINRNYKIASIHSKMCNSFPKDWTTADPMQAATIESIHLCLKGEMMQYQAPANARNITGSATGELIGGNLKTLESLAGSKSDIHTKNKILFVEDTGEYLYSIDRMFWNLKRSGKLSGLGGLIIGGFKIKKDDVGEEFGRSLEDIVTRKISGYRFPVCFDFPVGHQKNNFALKCGVIHKLSVSAEGSTLTEMRTS